MNNSNISVFDSNLYSTLFTQPEMKEIWSDKNLISSWLTFEVTIAKVQAELGLIPLSAVHSIQSVCNIKNINWDRLTKDTETVGMAIKPLIDQLSELGDNYVKKYIHWGCTTQDLLDTSLAMRLKQALDIIYNQLILLGNQIKEMAVAHKKTVMVARTNSMDALPTTWGLHVCGYLQEITRHIIRFKDIYPRAITGMYGGAVGNLSSTSNQGLIVRKNLFTELGLTEPKGINNASMDNIVEVIQFFALIHGSLCRIANDVETMGRASTGEIREGETGGDSSTMPHKANPRAANMIQTLSRMGWMYASSAPNLMDQKDVRSASMRVLNWSIVPEACLALSTSLDRAERLITNLIINKSKMLENFSVSYNLVMSESVMMKIAEKVGRNKSYKIVKESIKKSNKNIELIDILKKDKNISNILSPTEIEDACKPENYLGCNDNLIAETIKYYDKTINDSL